MPVACRTFLARLPACHYAWQDQARGGGAGGPETQSGGFSGSAGRLCPGASGCLSGDTESTPNIKVPHFKRQSHLSEHGALGCVSQHGQLLAGAGFVVPWQSAMAGSAAMSADAATCMPIRICVAAHAKPTGARATDQAITIANVARRTGTPENVRCLCGHHHEVVSLVK
jgi:hypothetical protein